MNLTDIRHLFDYTEWSNDLAMDAAAKLSDDNLRRDVAISHKSIFGTLLHMAGANGFGWKDGMADRQLKTKHGCCGQLIRARILRC